MSTFSDLLASVGLAPKTLPQAKETLDTAKATLDSVASLFTAAGLNLEQMLAAGPDALNAHLDSLDNSEELAEALQENEKLSTDLAAAISAQENSAALNLAFSECFDAVGLATGKIDQQDFKTAFESHVSKQTTLALAKTGHPPAHVPASAIDDITPPKNSEDASAKAALTSYEALIVADNQARTAESAKAKTDFYVKHHALIDRGITLRRRG